MKKRRNIILLSLVLAFFLICITVFIISFHFIFLNLSGFDDEYEETEEKWGSFTAKIAYSYDNQYYAVQSVHNHWITVSVYSSETDELIGDFEPARSWDFWGICWESNTYNIWIQSGDIGTYCYVYRDGEWVLDRNAERPEDIVSKYDKYKKDDK